jgi:pimeloyl-ACP methyl ester carboxylesterase
MVLCVHSSGGSSRQWDALAGRLQSDYQVVAADLHGHGGTPAWPGAQAVSIADEAMLLEPLIRTAQGGVHLVGHSYGAAVALRLALCFPRRVRSVAVYEPTLFRFLFDANPAHRDALEVVRVAVGFRRRASAGDLASAARRFMDYWGGDGAWDRLAPRQREAVTLRMQALCDHFRALLNDDTRLGDLRRIACPVLYLTGGASRSPVRAIARRIRAVLGSAEFVELPGLNHMAPITDPEAVNALIEDFLRRRGCEVAAAAALAAAEVFQHERRAAA